MLRGAHREGLLLQLTMLNFSAVVPLAIAWKPQAPHATEGLNMGPIKGGLRLSYVWPQDRCNNTESTEDSLPELLKRYAPPSPTQPNFNEVNIVSTFSEKASGKLWRWLIRRNPEPTKFGPS